jgi:hypothetical protein
MKLAIVGTRTPSISYSEFEQLLLEKIDLGDVTLIVSGGAQGIDTYAKLFAAHHHIPLMEYRPQYDVYGQYATLKRNTQIVQEANVVIAFPSAESKGTYHSIKEAERLHRRLIVVRIR